MDNGWKNLIGIIIVFFIVVNALIIVVGMDYPDGFALTGIEITGEYRYDVTLSGTGTATNVTLMIPLPCVGGNSPVGDAIVRGNAEGIGARWAVSEVGTDDFVMLKITAPSLSFVDGPITFGTTVSAPDLIDTAEPGDETYLLRLKKDPIDKNGVTHYTSSLYAVYDMSEDEGMDISICLEGVNTWRYPVLSENHFRDTLTFAGGAHSGGWQTADGILTAGIGKYSVI
ncbi:MAG: hypothetical protein GX097_09255 [Methanomicrobiales archaeon]|jgi:hypothetical protein|nr:hypothetical protein [Methanomicrobiales archaeon]